MYLKRKTPFGMFFNIFRAGGGYAAVALLVTCVARLEVMIVGFYAEAVGWTVLVEQTFKRCAGLQTRLAEICISE